jgi:hypothetical protein
LVCGLALLAVTANGQTAAPLDSQRWAELREELSYEEAPLPQPPAEEPDRPVNLGPTAKYLLIGLLALGVVVLLVIMLRDYWRRRPAEDSATPAVQLEHIAEDRLTMSEADALIARAVANEQWSVAIRLHFLALLKDLQDQGRITWRRDKTNRDYNYELSGAPDYGAFAQLVTAYEAAWYGDHPPTAAGYHRLATAFQDFRSASRAYASTPSA